MDIDRTVLVIEAEDRLRAVMASALERRGYKVLQADNGAQASWLTATEPLHLIVLDALLQDTDGVRWLGAIREQGNRVRVIFLSERRPNPGTTGRLVRELGVSMVLHRLVDTEVLGAQVERLVGRSHLQWKAQQTAELAETLAALGTSYGRRLPGKLDELAQAIAEACAAPCEPRRELVRFLSNRIRGTAGSYGFASIGDAVRRIERVLDGMGEQGPEGAVAAWQIIEEALAVARSLLAAHGAAAPPSSATDIVSRPGLALPPDRAPTPF